MRIKSNSLQSNATEISCPTNCIAVKEMYITLIRPKNIISEDVGLLCLRCNRIWKREK